MTNEIITHSIISQLGRNTKLRGIPIEDKLEYYSVPVTESGCHIWLGYTNKSGYGTIHYNGGSKLAHRVAYELEYGNLGSKCALHKCDNRQCINPLHLYAGTNSDNINDKVARGRAFGLAGEDNPNSKLTDRAVYEIRSSNKPSHALAKEYKVSLVTISRVKNNHSWRG